MEILKHTPEKIEPFIKVKDENGEENTYYAFNYKGVPKDLRVRYERELHETAENKENGLRKLKEIIKIENLDSLDDSTLLAILRSCKFNLKKSSSKLRNFIVHRQKFLRRLAAIDMSLVETVLEDTPIGILPYRDRHGRVIIYSRPYGLHLDKYSIEDGVIIGTALVLFALSLDLSTAAGVVYLGDCSSPSINILITIINNIRTTLPSLLSLPLRVGKVEVLNEFTLVRWCLNILRPLVPEKIFKRIKLHGPYENLQKSYPTEILPKEFGGSLGPLSHDFYKKQLLDFTEKLREEGKSMTSDKFF